MNPSSSPASLDTEASAHPAIHEIYLSVFLLIQACLMLSAVYILSSSIQWPQTLSAPPRELMGLIRDHPQAVQLGYLCYLLSTLFFVPVAILFHAQLDHTKNPLLRTGLYFGISGVVFKSLGILRWLTIQPMLAELIDDSTRSQAAILLFDSINIYFGTVGEVFGVMLGIGTWTLLIGTGLRSRYPDMKVLSYFAIILGAVTVLGSLRLVGLSLPGWYLSFTGAGFQLWSLALAVQIFRQTRRNKSPSPCD